MEDRVVSHELYDYREHYPRLSTRLTDNGQLLFANMTLYASDRLPIVLMERFEGLTSSVDCNGTDGFMSLTFKSKAAYDYALRAWQYVNEKDDENFLLIANHEGCSPNDERQPYK